MFFWEVVFLVLLSRSQYIGYLPISDTPFSLLDKLSYLQARTRLFQFICISLAQPRKIASAFTESLRLGKDGLVLYKTLVRLHSNQNTIRIALSFKAKDEKRTTTTDKGVQKRKKNRVKH
jgi:hypothetical protein